MLTQSTDTQPLHACFFYDSIQQRHKVLASYFQEGLDNKELCVFVTHETPRQVLTAFKRLGHDITDAVASGAFRIFDMDSAYITDGRFISDFMLKNVKIFIEDAKSNGYNGLRTAGEMTWLCSAPEFTDEAKQYESDINSLTTPNGNFTGICLYPTENANTKIVADALQTHPGYLEKEHIRANPHYKPVSKV